MDPRIITEMLPFNAYNKGYEMEVQNQLRQAQANQLVQEALRSQQMLPIDIRSKEADIRFKDAQAEQMLRDKTDPLKAAKAKAEMMNLLIPDMATVTEPYSSALKDQDAIGMSQALGGTPEGNFEAFNSVLAKIEKIDPDAAKTIKASASPIDALVNYYQSRREQTNPYVKMYGADKAAEAKMSVAAIMAGAQDRRTEVLEKIAKLKQIGGANVGKAASGFEMQGNKYFDMAVKETDPDKKKALTDQAQYFYNLALQKAEQAAMARQTGDIQFTPQPGTGITTQSAPPKASTPPTGGKPSAKASDF